MHRFGGGGDGLYPASNLIDVGGLLYGTTRRRVHTVVPVHWEEKGAGGSITRSGTEKVLHSFGDTDGAIPDAALIDVQGTLYGATSAGGEYDCYPSSACGTVFSITTAGVENVLHSFGKGADGLEPEAGLIDVKGTLYGTTRTGPGGTKYCGFYYGGCGTVFSITTGGKEKVLHSFAGDPDGAFPSASLLDVDGTLYGTTVGGGAYLSCEGTQIPKTVWHRLQHHDGRSGESSAQLRLDGWRFSGGGTSQRKWHTLRHDQLRRHVRRRNHL